MEIATGGDHAGFPLGEKGLSLGGRVTGRGLALDIVDPWLKEPFSGAERHVRRLEKVAALEAVPPPRIGSGAAAAGRRG